VEQYKTEKAVYTPTDLVLWHEHNMLEITPKFQRRGVWGTPARSYFIDTILRGMTAPPLYFRMIPGKLKTQAIRQVVDGQQRVKSVLDFIADGFRLSPSLNASWAGKRFQQLSESDQKKIMGFNFSVEVFHGISDQAVLEVFCRLNMNGVPLNKQELRNGRFFGRFKQASYELALRFLDFWTSHRIFTNRSIARMLEVELTSELLIAGTVGMQDKKGTIDDFYEEWENKYPTQARDEKRFVDTITAISESFRSEIFDPNSDEESVDDALQESAFRRPPLFYSLYCTVYHHLFGLPGIKRPSPKKKLTPDDRDSLRQAVIRLSDIVVQSKDPTFSVPNRYVAFVAACQRQTDNINPRRVRFDSLFDEAF
jgi:hypothetical protein